MKHLDISIIAPAHNEKENLKLFIEKTKKAVAKITKNYEIIIVDDGSTDNSLELLKKIKKNTPKLKIIRLRRHSGQTAGIMAGFSFAKGNIVVVLDADLQQDPASINKLVSPILKGQADVASGRRQKRQHSLLIRLVAVIEYFLNKWFLKIDIKDTAVSPNAYKKDALKDLNLYGEMHRFLVPILHWRGFKIIEVNVPHFKRHAGKSKYKPSKAVRGFLDLIIIKFWQDFSARPIHFFGNIGLILIFLGVALGIEEAVRKLVFHISIYNRTLPLLAAFLTIIGIQFLILGILADILIKIYYKKTPAYQIEAVID